MGFSGTTVLDLVDTDGVDLSKNSVFQAPGDHVFDRIEVELLVASKPLRKHKTTAPDYQPMRTCG